MKGVRKSQGITGHTLCWHVDLNFDRSFSIKDRGIWSWHHRSGMPSYIWTSLAEGPITPLSLCPGNLKQVTVREAPASQLTAVTTASREKNHTMRLKAQSSAHIIMCAHSHILCVSVCVSLCVCVSYGGACYVTDVVSLKGVKESGNL